MGFTGFLISGWVFAQVELLTGHHTYQPRATISLLTSNIHKHPLREVKAFT
jgi:hypothetical protein